MNVNAFVIIVAAFILGKMIQGHKRGMVKEIISLISLIVISVLTALLAKGLESYLQKEMVSLVVAVILILAIIIIHSLISVFFFTAKVFSKLPVVHWADKMMGIIVGALEGVLFLWILYYFIALFGLGEAGSWILAATRENEILVWIAEHNYLFRFLDEYGVTKIISDLL